MRRGPLAASRAGIGLRIACVAAFGGLTAGPGSCATSGSSSVTATGKTLTIYASVPTGMAQAADVADAERLALERAGTQLGKFRLRLLTAQSPKVSNNARTAIEDQSTVAYIGELSPGASAESMGITNAADVLQVTPADTAIELTQSTAAVPGAPDSYYEAHKTYGATLARVVPSAAQEARFLVARIEALKVNHLYVGSDGTPYGAAVALAVRNDAGSLVSASAAGADGAFFGASSPGAAGREFDSLAAKNPQVKLFAPSGAAGLSTTAHNVYISEPGFLPAGLPPAGKAFASQFKATYGHAPAQAAIFAYEAVSAVVAVLREAGSAANNRATVVHDFFGIRNRSSVLGTYSIDQNGDPSIAPFVLYRLRSGALVPLR